MHPSAPANEEAIEAWNGVLFDKFVRFRQVVVAGLAGHGDEVLRRHPPAAGARVLDVGCGFGDTTRQLAAIVGERGLAVGIDAASRFIDTARTEAAEAGLDHVRFVAGDAQVATFEVAFDYAFSRFGTMFFASAVAALRNVRRALRPGGRLAMVVWRQKAANEFLHLAELAVLEILPRVEDSGAVTCGPGPFSMASADVTSDVLTSAGFCGITFERHDADICIGLSMAEAIEFAIALGPAGEIIRLAGELGERERPRVEVALAEVLSPYLRPDGSVWAPSSVWIVTAQSPS